MALLCVTVVVLILSGTEAGAGQKKYKIGIAAGKMGNTWTAQFAEVLDAGMRKYIADGIISDYQLASTDGNVTEQVTQCMTMINSGVDALLIWPVSPGALQGVVDAAHANGIVVVNYNDLMAYDGVISIVCDNYAFQRIQAIWLVERLNGKGDIVQITGTPGFSSDDMRQKAAAEVFAKYPGIRILGSAPGNWHTTVAQQAMTTFLATYDDIDAVFSQDVMAEGILKAYENAGIEPEVMTGDYTAGFFRKWVDIPGLDSIGVTNQHSLVINAVDVALNLLDGKKIKPGVLESNPLNPELINMIPVAPAYVVTREGDQNAPWMQGLVGSRAITLDGTLKLLEGKPDTAGLDGCMTREEVAQFFE
jgi:ribose transport system substrate-binding protein